MGQEVLKLVKHRKFDHPTIVNSNKSGNVRVLWNYTTYDVIPSTSSKHPNRVSLRCTNRNVRVNRYLDVVAKIMGEYR